MIEHGLDAGIIGERPSISVVIPTLNEEAFLGSLLAQLEAADLRSQIEVIVVDGGSSDATLSLCDTVDQLLHCQQRGIARARNMGAIAGRAELLFNTDADVIFRDVDDLLNRLTVIFEDPEVVGVIGTLAPYPWEARARDRFMHALGNGLIRLALRFGGFLARGEFLIVRRDTFDAVGGFNEALIVGEDCDLVRRIHKHGRVVWMRRTGIYHSTRRFREWGYMRTCFVFAREGLSLLLRRRSYVSEWTSFR